MQEKIEIASQPRILTPQCSCSKCDSVDCFARRRADEPCPCDSCKVSKSCIFYNINTNPSESSVSINSQEIERELTPEKTATEFVKNISNKHSRVSYGRIKKEEDNTDSNKAKSGLEVSVTYSGKEACLSAAKLSAQIMDLPYKDFQNSYKSNLSTNIMKISPFDIFNRIKEVYKACSCKFCECVVGKSLQNELCKCKPCDCNDCANINKNVKSISKSGKQIPDNDGCPCIRCERGSCKGIGKKTTDANECDCVGLLKHDFKCSNSFSQACNCVHCQCIECKFLSVHRNKALIVAPVGEEYQQHNTCQCSPCECFACGHGYGLSNQHREMSTSVNRHPYCHCEMCANEACVPDDNQSCRCERQSRVMSKPFQRDSHDYDIRRTNVKYGRHRKYSNTDTIAMFAALTNAYPKLDKTKNQCDCDNCECLQCQYKESAGYANTSHNFFEPISTYKLNNDSYECSCAPCECQICAKMEIDKSYNSCSCDVCDCVSCGGLENAHCKRTLQAPNGNKQPKIEYSANGDCKCNVCECVDCENYMSTCSRTICKCLNCKCESCISKGNCFDKDIYSVKRGERLTPTIFKKKIKDAFIESCINTLEGNEDSFKLSEILKSPVERPSAFSAFQRTKPTSDQNLSIQNFNRRLEIVKRAHVVKDKNGLNENINLIVDSNGNSSESTNVIPLIRRGLPYWESSYNGKDYSNGILNFPSSTAKTCLNDIMQFDSSMISEPTQNTKNQFYAVREQQHTTPETDKETNETIEKSYVTKLEPAIESNIYKNKGSGYVSLMKHAKDDSILHYTESNFENNPYLHHNLDSIPETQKCYLEPDEECTNSLSKYCHSTDYENRLTADNNEIDLNNLKLIKDYERVRNTLHEARVFSLQLVELLQKYEKANQEFESVSDKIKKLNDTSNLEFLKNSKTGLKRILLARDDVPTKEIKSKTSCGSSTEELVEINENARVNFSSNYKCSSEDERNISSEDMIHNSKDKSSEDLTVISKNKETINDEPHQKHKKKNYIKKLHRKYNKMYKHSRIHSNRTINATNTVGVDATIATEDIIKLVQSTPQPINENHTSKEVQNFTRDDIKRNINVTEHFLKGVNNSSTELTVSVTEKYSKGEHCLQHEVEIVKHPNIEHKRQIVDFKSETPSLMKKHFCLNTNTNEFNRRFSIFSPLEKSIKDTVQSIALQPETENATYIYENKALVKLHSEVKKLLDMPILQTKETDIATDKGIPDNWKTTLSQTISAEDNCNGVNNINQLSTSSRKSCDALKVNSLHVRRVSDHTVLVKWDAPRAMDNVKGYELLVDGRAVQKILSPSRRMAVLTCLPHSDRILLTVRTVVIPPCHHLSACTVVYQPRHRFYG